jgi:hypothetical protein
VRDAFQQNWHIGREAKCMLSLCMDYGACVCNTTFVCIIVATFVPTNRHNILGKHHGHED